MFAIVDRVLFLDMIRTLDSACIRHMPLSEAFRNIYLPKLCKSKVDKAQSLRCARKIGVNVFRTQARMRVADVSQAAGDMTARATTPDLRRKDSQFYPDLATSEELLERQGVRRDVRWHRQRRRQLQPHGPCHSCSSFDSSSRWAASEAASNLVIQNVFMS